MYIKILCPCGVKFGFDVEPRDGAMPANIACPACGADATALGNEAIRQASAPAPSPAAAPKLKLSGHAPAAAETVPPPPPAPSAEGQPPADAPVSPANAGGGLRLSRSSAHQPPAPAPAAPTESAAPKAEGSMHCAKHNETAEETCRMCGKPICPKCMETFGYVCSAYCKRRADDEGVLLPVFANQRSERMATERRSANKLFAVAGGVVAVLVIAWGWYEFSGSRPKQVMSLSLSQAGGGQTVLVDATRFAVVSGTQAAMHDFGSGEVLWTVQLPQGATGAPRGMSFDDDGFGYARNGFTAAGDLWVVAPGKLLRLAADNGAIKAETPMNGRAAVDVLPWSATVTVFDASGRQSLVQVDRETGDVKTFDVGTASSGTRRLAAAGDSAVQMDVRLLERRIVMKDTLKDTERRVAPGNVSTGRSVEAMQDIINEMKRDTGETKMKVDESRYEVTLRRLGGATAPDWKGEVIGEPALFVLKTMDVVAGGQELHVFDRSNRRLWEAKLSFTLSPGGGISAFGGGMGGFYTGAERIPFVEGDGTLFACDAGTLIAFDRASGEARWRVPLVGISTLRLGDDGNLYLAATTATPDAILYPDQVNLMEKVRPVIAKIRARDGKLLWQTENRGPDLIVTGKYVYAGASSSAGFAALIQGRREASENFNLYRLSASLGRDVWHLHEPGYVSQMDAVGTRILLQFPGEIRGFKFLSF
jgi:outer membrane protein assembly factor BamB